jgi:Mad3/BUB1 homology region 2
VNLEQIYVGNEEFSFEEILAKKKGLYGLKFEVERPKSSPRQAALERSPEVFQTKIVLRSPLDEKHEVQQSSKTASHLQSPVKTQVHIESNEPDEVVLMPLRGKHSINPSNKR